MSFLSPVGWLSIFEENGKLIAVEAGKTDRNAGGLVLRKAKQSLLEYFSGDRILFNVPIKLKGSEFQLAVWQEISKIPYGETLTYGSIAKKIKTSPRAVGMACGKNPLPILIPCHRITGTQSLLGGFSFGAGKKTKLYLLQLESRHKNSVKQKDNKER